MTHSARSGIIIKSGAHMERLAQVRHGRLRQDRNPDARPSRGDRHHRLQQEHNSQSPAGPCRGGRNASATPRRRGPAQQGERTRGQSAALRRDQLPHRSGRRRPGQRLLSACRQRAVHAAERDHRSTAPCWIAPALDEHGYSCLYIAVDGELAGLVALCRHDPARKPGRDQEAARDGREEHRDADRRQRGRRAGGRQAPRPRAGNTPT